MTDALPFIIGLLAILLAVWAIDIIARARAMSRARAQQDAHRRRCEEIAAAIVRARRNTNYGRN